MNLPSHPLPLANFNREYIAWKRERGKAIGIHKVKGFSFEKNVNRYKERYIDGVFGKALVEKKLISSRKTFDTTAFNNAIVAWLQMYTQPLKASVTNTTGKYIPNVGFVANTADKGRADITAQYPDFELCIETKQAKESQLKSQKEFEAMVQQQSFRKYFVVRGWIDFQQQMLNFFGTLQDSK